VNLIFVGHHHGIQSFVDASFSTFKGRERGNERCGEVFLAASLHRLYLEEEVSMLQLTNSALFEETKNYPRH
jgi:hypothetical protein